MPIGKDSITKRVAKTEVVTEAPVAEAVETPAVETIKKAPAKKTSTAKTSKTVIANVAPETVEAVIGHKENKEVEKVTSYVKKKHDTEYDKSVIEEIEKNAAESKTGKEEAAEKLFWDDEETLKSQAYY